jgi:multidrug resistance efflux pump
LEEAAEEINQSDKDKSSLKSQLTHAQHQVQTLTAKLKISELDLKNYERAAEFRLSNPFKDNPEN